MLLVLLEVTHLQTFGEPSEPCHVQKMSESCQQVAISCHSGCSQRSAPLDLDDETRPCLWELGHGSLLSRIGPPSSSTQHLVLLFFCTTVRALVTAHVLLPCSWFCPTWSSREKEPYREEGEGQEFFASYYFIKTLRLWFWSLPWWVNKRHLESTEASQLACEQVCACPCVPHKCMETSEERCLRRQPRPSKLPFHMPKCSKWNDLFAGSFSFFAFCFSWCCCW